MKVVPHNDAVLCRQINADIADECSNGIVYKRQQLPLYQVLEVGENVQSIQLDVGDIIVVDAIPTKFNVDNEILFIVRDQHIAGKVKQ